MISAKDINKIISAFKNDFYTKDVMDEKFSKLQNSVDGIAKGFKEFKVELTVQRGRIDIVEEKIGIKPVNTSK
jgi:hypothetical protein